MAFQSYAFQIGAFQYNTSAAPAPVPGQNSGGWFDRPYKGSRREQLETAKRAVEQLPQKIKTSIKKIARSDKKKYEREAALLSEINHIDSAFQLVYLDYLERLHADWVEREIARLFYEKQMALRARQNEEALILLLLL